MSTFQGLQFSLMRITCLLLFCQESYCAGLGGGLTCRPHWQSSTLVSFPPLLPWQEAWPETSSHRLGHFQSPLQWIFLAPEKARASITKLLLCVLQFWSLERFHAMGFWSYFFIPAIVQNDLEFLRVRSLKREVMLSAGTSSPLLCIVFHITILIEGSARGKREHIGNDCKLTII